MFSSQKVEIIVSNLELNAVIEILDMLRVSGYIIWKNIEGKGDRGISSDDLDRAFSYSYLMTICEREKQVEILIEELEPLLKKVGGICMVTDVKSIVH